MMMAYEKFGAPDLQKFIAGLGSRSDHLTDIWRRPEPELLPVPAAARGFRIRIDLQHTKPPVWRRIEVPGDVRLPRLHEVLQAAMGWTDSHLHRFRTSNDRNAPEFLTQFDLDEGDEGMLEDDVRLDQVVSTEGDKLWYDYDFGDGWEHILRVEKVLDSPPPAPACVGGKLACPPEDCGGVWGYAELAGWVRSDYDDALRPAVFESSAVGRAWLPDGWHPDVFDIEATRESIAAVAAEPIPVVEELGSLLELARNRGTRTLRDMLARPSMSGATEVGPDAAALVDPFLALLDVIGDGMTLSGAGHLKPSAVQQVAQRTGITEWWIGKANREDLTWPVWALRITARKLGLVTVRKGRIAPSRAIAKHRDDPPAILRHIAGRLPLGTTAAERHAGWMSLVVVANGTPAERWGSRISELLFDLGWRDPDNPFLLPWSGNPTLDALHLLAGAARADGRPAGANPAVAAFARSVMRP